MGFPHTPFLTVTGTLSLYRQTTAPFGAFLFFATLPRGPGHAALKKGHVTDGAPHPSARASLRWESPASQVNIILSVSQPKPPPPKPAKIFFSHPLCAAKPCTHCNYMVSARPPTSSRPPLKKFFLRLLHAPVQQTAPRPHGQNGFSKELLHKRPSIAGDTVLLNL